ncbi:hypothetical protein BKA70DRAFT_1181501 [Coprinopsis sp. MPI-PUGE-AT-0042]|nr:hypothetical protein BKA70DRAFT_1181501 [Coprinopsis sp. MPI-PUGE-AT-0042]
MSTTTKTTTTTIVAHSRRNSSVYVQIPPFDKDCYQSFSAASPHVSLKHNENTPLIRQPAMPSSSSSGTPSVKRKLSDTDQDEPIDAASAKRARAASNAGSTSAPFKPSQLNSPSRAGPIEIDLSKATAEFPNGFTYCHQCCKKRDLAITIHCTFIEEREVGKTKSIKQKRCVQRFCKPCLKNRYGEDIDELRRNKKKLDGHLTDAGFYFHCYKCKDECNCPRCRKDKGLEPLGNMAIKKSASGETASAPKKEPKKTTKAEPKVPEKKAEKPRAKPKPRKTKTVEPVKWTRTASALSQSELEERIYTREFLLRFNHLSEAPAPKAQLEELEQLNGNGKALHGVEELDGLAWVNDACVKSVISSLLGLCATASDNRIAHASQTAIKALKPVGLHLTKIWSALQDWQSTINAGVASTSYRPPKVIRDDVSTTSSLTELSDDEDEESAVLLEEPKALSLVVLAALEQGRRATRGMTSATATTGNSVAIMSSSQMVPTILSLIDFVLGLGLENMKSDMDEGLKNPKELTRKVRECVKGENERWEAVRKERESMKEKDKTKDKARFQAAKKLHKDILTTLDQCPSLLQSESLLRYTPLGTDPDGRVYHILSPGHAEREAATEYIDMLHTIRERGVSSKMKLKKKGRIVKAEERDELVEYSWMVLVWGRIPEGKEAFCLNADEDAMDVDGAEKDDSTKERWYTFAQPEDIKLLAEWVAAEYGLDDDAEEGSVKSSEKDHEEAAMKELVKGLKDFADLMEWRSTEDKYRLPNESLDAVAANGNASVNGASAKGASAKTKAIPPEQFYDRKK